MARRKGDISAADGERLFGGTVSLLETLRASGGTTAIAASRIFTVADTPDEYTVHYPINWLPQLAAEVAADPTGLRWRLKEAHKRLPDRGTLLFAIWLHEADAVDAYPATWAQIVDTITATGFRIWEACHYLIDTPDGLVIEEVFGCRKRPRARKTEKTVEWSAVRSRLVADLRARLPRLAGAGEPSPVEMLLVAIEVVLEWYTLARYPILENGRAVTLLEALERAPALLEKAIGTNGKRGR
ncbi:MAG: hypothetical protein HYY04_15510 [Chloroflexi bacterium]|nr:hypothetical protein [Chloroflexota bacterium]